MRSMFLSSSLLVFAVSVPSCGGGGTPARPAEPAAAAPSVRCYAGPSKIFLLPDNRPVGEGTIVARRTVDPSRNLISEDVAAVTPGEPVREFHVEMAVTGSKFTMTEANGAFTGEGDLVGTPWEWTEWTSTSRLPDGMVVKATDLVTATGFTGEKIVTTGDGVDRVRIVEEITAVDCAGHDQRVADLRGK